MSNAEKLSISVADPDLIAWAKERAERTGMSVSSVITEAMRHERERDAMKHFIALIGPDAIPTPEERAAIRAEQDAPQNDFQRKQLEEEDSPRVTKVTSTRR